LVRQHKNNRAKNFAYRISAIVLYGFGTAATIFILSLVKSSVVAPEYESASGRDLSIIVIIQTIGTLAGTPLFAALWVLGLKSDGFMLGLPYFTAAVCSRLKIWCVKLTADSFLMRSYLPLSSIFTADGETKY